MRPLKAVAGSLLTFMLLLFSSAAFAGMEEEIAHLLSYVEDSGCTFVRNGKEHTAAEGREHIEMKYDHVKKRVQSTEDFIEYAASKSSLSGTPYLVRCGDDEMAAAEWLSAELARLRQPGGEETMLKSPAERSSP